MSAAKKTGKSKARKLFQMSWTDLPLRGRPGISCTFLLAVAGVLLRCPSLAVLALRRYDRQNAHLIPERPLNIWIDRCIYRIRGIVK